MNDSAVDFWLSAAGRVPLLTAKQEVMFGRAVRAWLDHPDPPPDVVRRGLRARDRMLTANLRLVVALARRFHGPLQQRGLTMADGLQEGTLGLLRGVEKFDPTRGYKFSTYAYWWIRQGISRAIEMAGLIRLPVDLQQHVRRGLSEAEWTAATDSYRERFQCVQAAHSISSLDARLGGNDREGSAMVDLIVDQRDIDSRRDEEEASAIEALIAEAREAVNGYEWALLLRGVSRKTMPRTAQSALASIRLRLGVKGVA